MLISNVTFQYVLTPIEFTLNESSYDDENSEDTMILDESRQVKKRIDLVVNLLTSMI
jgi:hypothetical protein